MEARLASLNLSHYAAALRAHEIDDDILKLMTVADLREAGLDPTAAQRLHANLSGVAAPPGLAPAPTAPESEDPVDLSRLHYGVEDYVKMGVPEEDARAILRAVNKLAKDRDDAAVASGAAADLDAEA